MQVCVRFSGAALESSVVVCAWLGGVDVVRTPLLFSGHPLPTISLQRFQSIAASSCAFNLLVQAIGGRAFM